MNAIIPDMKIVEIIVSRFNGVGVFRISRIAAAVPVLVFWIEKIVMNERAITIVFIIPIVKRNCLVSCSVISDDINAACPAPNPGRKEAKGAVSAAEIDDFKILDFLSFIFFKGVIFCGGIFVLFFIDTIKVEKTMGKRKIQTPDMIPV